MHKTDLLRSFDDIQFGSTRTLNLRDGLPSAADARYRADAWLRQRQATSIDDVLIVTGRGNGSPDGVPAIKQEIILLLHSLRRQGVVKDWREHTPGSFAVKPAKMTELLSAMPRRREPANQSIRRDSSEVALVLDGLTKETAKLLRTLAERSLDDLGIKDRTGLVDSEMARQLSVLTPGLPATGDRDAALRLVIIRATEELDAGKSG